MTLLNLVIAARNNAASPPGTPVTGLTPAWVILVRKDTLAAITPQPTFTEIGHGLYRFQYDVDTYGDAVGQIDLGATLPNPADRYIDVDLAHDPLTALSAAPPATLVPESVAEALVLARAVLAGKGMISANGQQVTFYRHDGTTQAVQRGFPASVITVPTLPETITTTG